MERCYRIGAVAVIGAALLRLGLSSIPQKLVDAVSRPEVVQGVLFAQTGHWASLPQAIIHQAESAAPILTPVPQPLAFSPEDAQLVTLQNVSGKEVDVKTLLTQQLSWKLAGQEPTVLILHTHTSESYTYTGGYEEDTAYRTLDEDYNMLCIGQALAQQLQAAGIGVIQDRSFHDYPSYNGSYVHARDSLSQYLEQYPSIRLVLDLHRDALADRWGNQLSLTCTVDNREAAQIMLVIGSNHDNWQQNMALAVKLHARLEQLYPGLCRPIAFRSSRFNQDLSDGALLIEIGAAGNTRQQALYTASLLSNAIIDLQNGSN